jgi:hypothetical protein
MGSMGSPETIFMMMAIVILAGPIAAVIIKKRFERSKKARLAGPGPADALQAGHEKPPVPFVSPEAAGRWTKRLLLATLILAGVAVVSGLLQVELLSRMARGTGFTMEEAALNDSRQRLIGGLQSLLWIGTSISFLIWFHRMHKNLPSLGQKRLIFTPGWAVGFFFVPFHNFVLPFQAMREICQGSDPERFKPAVSLGGSSNPDRPGTPLLIHFWWALFHLTNITLVIAERDFILAPAAPTLPELQAHSALAVAADLFLIASALVTVRLVGRLTGWQVERAELIRRRGGLPASVPAGAPAEAEKVEKKPLKRKLVWAGTALVAVAIVLFGVLLTRENAPVSQGPFFTIGSTKEDVRRIQGPPEIDSGLYWWYGRSVVHFDLDGKVIEYSDNAKNLRVKSR